MKCVPGLVGEDVADTRMAGLARVSIGAQTCAVYLGLTAGLLACAEHFGLQELMANAERLTAPGDVVPERAGVAALLRIIVPSLCPCLGLVAALAMVRRNGRLLAWLVCGLDVLGALIAACGVAASADGVLWLVDWRRSMEEYQCPSGSGTDEPGCNPSECSRAATALRHCLVIVIVVAVLVAAACFGQLVASVVGAFKATEASEALSEGEVFFAAQREKSNVSESIGSICSRPSAGDLPVENIPSEAGLPIASRATSSSQLNASRSRSSIHETSVETAPLGCCRSCASLAKSSTEDLLLESAPGGSNLPIGSGDFGRSDADRSRSPSRHLSLERAPRASSQSDPDRSSRSTRQLQLSKTPKDSGPAHASSSS
mmetsp:Transcript_32269/g.94368  ORF Transcript_32269/g.94368 Transcript_32269/m.94368 type:complete len:373 (+) Transcript_32269:23-1141(+)|eukprot:CAMPEP_0170214440 /NCGR_PEP_ID=MMETSP0116_2-20130129/6851_1 /TAXON_ID=400756 /ORGANISM="Durinskia baltica, Strain CSIRO CS-38" /LENGTH=372 /DNA_ID=CAMNT_0010465005 /DNA_START=19 /DNA_END=1137 /DNA_ORIENTATION=+